MLKAPKHLPTETCSKFVPPKTGEEKPWVLKRGSLFFSYHPFRRPWRVCCSNGCCLTMALATQAEPIKTNQNQSTNTWRQEEAVLSNEFGRLRSGFPSRITTSCIGAQLVLVETKGAAYWSLTQQKDVAKANRPVHLLLFPF